MGSEPVAWMYTKTQPGGPDLVQLFDFQSPRRKGAGWTETPLYTRPPASEPIPEVADSKDGASADADRATRASTEPASGLGHSAGIPSAADIEVALHIAMLAHRGQVDKAGQPYIFHPIRVAGWLDDPRKKIVALLHDVLEDSGFPEPEIRQQFGDEIADAVVALTRKAGQPYADFIDQCGAIDLARAVKWADLRDNMDLSRLSTVTQRDLDRTAKYRAAADRLNAIALAKGTEARRATTGTGVVHDGPVPAGHSPKGGSHVQPSQ